MFPHGSFPRTEGVVDPNGGEWDGRRIREENPPRFTRRCPRHDLDPPVHPSLLGPVSTNLLEKPDPNTPDTPSLYLPSPVTPETGKLSCTQFYGSRVQLV